MTATTLFPDIESTEELAMPTNAQYDAQLETLAKLIEAKARTVEEAAQIVRDSKTVSEDTKRTRNETAV